MIGSLRLLFRVSLVFALFFATSAAALPTESTSPSVAVPQQPRFSLPAPQIDQTENSSASPLPAATVQIAAIPSSILVDTAQAFTVTIQVQAGAQPVDGASAYLNFDPAFVNVEHVSPGAAFNLGLQNTLSNPVGHIDYAAGTFSNFPSGSFTLLQVRMRALKAGDTTLEFESQLPRQTDATYGGASVFLAARGATIHIGSISSNTPSSPRQTSTPTNTSKTPTHTLTPSPTETYSATGTSTPTRTHTPTNTPAPSWTPSATPSPTIQFSIVEDDDLAIKYDKWQGMLKPKASGGGYRVSGIPSDSVTYRFKGTAITLVMLRAKNLGKFRVTIDRINKGTFDLYNEKRRFGFTLTFGNLANKRHKLTITVLGAKNPKSKGTRVAIDAFEVDGTRVQESSVPIILNKWRAVSSPHASGGTFHRSARGSVRFTFVGSSVQWVTARGPKYGQADVLIDGIRQGPRIDLYAPALEFQVPFEFGNLGTGPHTIEIRATHTRNSLAKGAGVVIDSFRVPLSNSGALVNPAVTPTLGE